MRIKMKKIIFFDGDGTLWYPKSTKHSCAPYWIYKNPKISKNPNKYLVLTPTTKFTLEKLKKLDIITIILSTHPYPPEEAQKILRKKTDYLQLTNYFNEIYATPNYYEAKGEFMINILKPKFDSCQTKLSRKII